MKPVSRSGMGGVILLLSLLFGFSESRALDTSVRSGYTVAQQPFTVPMPSGNNNGFDYLPNGDILYLENVLISDDGLGSRTYSIQIKKIDGNGDDIPATPETIAVLPDATYSGLLLRISPKGGRAIVGSTYTGQPSSTVVTGARMQQVDLSTGTSAFAPGGFSNLDAVFIDENRYWLSFSEAAPPVFGPVYKLALARLSDLSMNTAVQFSSADNAAHVIARSKSGDLYFLREDLDSAARLRMFKSRDLAAALVNGVPINESKERLVGNITISAPYSSRLAYDPNVGEEGAIYFPALVNSTTTIRELNLQTGKVANFAQFFDTVSPSITALRSVGRYGPFLANGLPIPEMRSVVSVDSASHLVGISQKPKARRLSARRAKLEAVKLRDNVRYRFTVVRSNSSQVTVTSRSNKVTVKNLLPGTSSFTYVVLKKINGQWLSTLPSPKVDF